VVSNGRDSAAVEVNERKLAAAAKCRTASRGSVAVIPAIAATRSVRAPPRMPPKAPPAAMRPIVRLAVRGSKRSLTTDQKPLTRSDPEATTWT
jgi:hypothetical protein